MKVTDVVAALLSADKDSEVEMYTKCGPDMVSSVDIRKNKVILSGPSCCRHVMDCDRDHLLDMLRTACVELCRHCTNLSDGNKCIGKSGSCFTQKLRTAAEMDGGMQ